MDAPSLDVLKAGLGGALGNLVSWQVSLSRQGVGTEFPFRSFPTQTVL